MDQRRFVAFLGLSIALLLLSTVIFPPPKQPPKPAAAGGAAAGNKAAADKEAGKDQVAEPDQAAGDAAKVAQPAIALPPAAAEDASDREFITLGSLEVDTGYRMLVTLTNQGAAVHRAELASPRFRDLNDRSGYLGHLALENADGGVKVGVVGLGTPAEKAGLKPGDIIVGFDGPKGKVTETRTVDDYEAARSATQPGQEITLRIIRDGAPQSLNVTLRRRPLEVMRPEIENIRTRDGTIPPGFVDPPSFLVNLASLGGKHYAADAATQLDDWLKEGHDKDDAKAKDLAEAAQLAQWFDQGNWTITQHDESSVTFEREVPGVPLKIRKHYKLEPAPAGSRSNETYPAYHFVLDVEVQNIGDAPQSVAYRLDGPTGLPIEGWWYAHKISQGWGAAGLRDVAVRYQGSNNLLIDCSKIAAGKTDGPMGQGKPLAYIGVDGLYFSSILIPIKQSLDDDWFDTTEAIRIGPKPAPNVPLTYTNVSCRLTRTPVEIAPGKSQRDSYEVFVGPKRPALLAEYQAAGDPNYSLADLIYYGWFGPVARGMLAVLHFFYSFIGNYGIAIVMLTVLVRGCMFPISFKQTQNMARMQALKPELDRITEKYKTDMQKRSAAMQDLYRKHSINPLGGCLPLFLQLPIFIGLYRSIMVDVELRDMPLFSSAIRWCSDLAAPDMLFNWSRFMPSMVNDGIGLFGLGRYFNLLPIITVCLFLVSQKLAMPPATNEQAEMQQKMMKYMTGFMGLFFFKVASGLCLYFIASSIWGLCERRLLGKGKKLGDPAGNTQAASTRATSSGNGRNGSTGKKKNPPAKRKK